MTTDHQPRLSAVQSRFHAQCLLCGPDNPQGLRLLFTAHHDGHVEALFPCDRLYQGYTGYLHGGIIAAVLDSAMTNCLFAHGKTALTGELTVRFMKPVVVSRHATVRAHVTRSMPPLFHLEATFKQDGDLMALAKARFMEAGHAGVALSQANDINGASPTAPVDTTAESHSVLAWSTIQERHNGLGPQSVT